MSIPKLRPNSFALASIFIGGVMAFSSARAAQATFNINANGAKEVTSGGVPNQGDLDGSATGTIVLNNGTGSGTTGSSTFSLTLSNIDLTTLSGHHIHIGATTTTGSIVLDFGDPDAIRTGNVVSGTISNLSATQITNILANPTNFYYNLHNGAFPGGAVRDQLVPEPTSTVLVFAGAVGLFALKRPRRKVLN
jgi:hypothetical protein